MQKFPKARCAGAADGLHCSGEANRKDIVYMYRNGNAATTTQASGVGIRVSWHG
jgi:hypothetical protein